MNRKELIQKFIEFFKSKNHAEIKNSSLIPENDPTVLFTTAGMHPLVPFLLGQKHPSGKRLCNVQRCIRTGDIDEVGDETHHTFFEMLGNWSLGDYWKKQAIEYSFEFLTKELGIKKKELEVTCFAGDKDAPQDKEAEQAWKKIGINKIKFLGKKENWWGPAGAVGPCGPDSEIFIKGVEIWNDVFMQYEKTQNGKYKEAKQKNIDTGLGVERTIAVLNNLDDNYLTGCFKPIIEQIEKISKKKYKNNQRTMRIIADHIKAAVFIIADGITPSNTEQGYVLRRLIRRAIVQARKLNLKNSADKIAEPIFEIYSDYEHLIKNKKIILEELKKEEEKFNYKTEEGLKLLEDELKTRILIDDSNKKEKPKIIKKENSFSGKAAFLLYQSYGFPLEMTIEILKNKKVNLNFNKLKKEFQKELTKHQQLSRTASAGKFKSGLADNSEATTKLHTATHLLLAALKKVLKDNSIIQKGSNINPERARFDFSFPRKLTDEEIKKIEDEVNKQIKKSLPVKREEMSPQQAKKSRATGIFESKYGNKVSVYTIGNYSKEICTGPHVKNTKELGHFKIIKEESSSSGVRRIKAVLK